MATLGESAGIITKVDDDGEKTFASAHDLRRSFGFRWSKKIMPPILQKLMRHDDINTTMKYYAIAGDDEVADAVWSAFTDTSTDTSPESLVFTGDKVIQ